MRSNRHGIDTREAVKQVTSLWLRPKAALWKKGKSYRGLNPWQEQDYKLLSFLAKGENSLNGFRNKDLRRRLYPESEDVDKQQRKKYVGRTTRRIKLLRVYGLVKKVAKENRYVLTSKGRKFACALMCASAVDIKGLTELAA